MDSVYFPTNSTLNMTLPSEDLMFMTRQDWALLLEKAITIDFSAGDVIVEKDSMQQAICIVKTGSVRVEREDNVLAVYGAGAVFGEMSFLENRETSASVIAQTSATIHVVEGMVVYGLLVSVPGFATRFYQTLAVVLARRLRELAAQFHQ